MRPEFFYSTRSSADVECLPTWLTRWPSTDGRPTIDLSVIQAACQICSLLCRLHRMVNTTFTEKDF